MTRGAGARAACVTAALVLALLGPPAAAQETGSSAGLSDAYPLPAFAGSDRLRAFEAAWPRIERILAERQRAMHAPGLSWGVVVDGVLVRSGGLGTLRAGTADPVTPDTVFRIASMTKSVTALAVLRLRDAGRLSLDEPVTRYLPEFANVRLPTADSPAITIRHLLTHAAGFPEDNPWGDRVLHASDDEVSAWLAAGIPFSTPPGTAYEYSNYGFALLGRIVARASGQPYREYVTREILLPLGMTSTWWDPADVPPVREAAGHRRLESGWRHEPSLPDGAFGAMGGLLMSGRDLGRYVAFMLSAWPARDDTDPGPVRRASVREMQQMARHGSLAASRSAAGVQAAAAGYGYGLRVSHDCAFRHIAGHSGGLPGFGSNMTWLPEHGVGVYVMANVTYAPAAAAVRAVIDELAATGGLVPRERPPSGALESARTALTALVNDWSLPELQRVAAVNLLLDRDAEARRSELSALRSRVGTCRPDRWIEVENWLRGRFRLACERGALDVAFTLAPTPAPAVQSLRVTEAGTADPMPPAPCQP